ncbi:molybdopterin-binding protein [Microaerobacter geothermalis]|uniref:molybdopterin-binding protein n=1 Tax=Microaerobacter geothermalis TaxID=674972 RepID=UPI001F390DDE|nr:molybdopterin-binding protein [Microaerobacter geothermalis]MCF6095241.1 molybdopterin-binding protein [Microaerobacter geothermalis]
MILAHDLTKIVPGEFKGRAFRKGHRIEEKDIPELLNIGKEHIYILELEEGELHENDAAFNLAQTISGANTVMGEAHEGKVMIRSAITGLLKIDEPIVHRMNEVEGIVISTRLTNQLVKENEPLAVARVIPLVIEKVRIDSAISCVKKPVVEVLPLRPLKVGIVTTGSEVYKRRIQDQFGPVVKEKVESLGCTVLEQRFAPDDLEVIRGEILDLIEKGAEIVLTTGGMSVDPDDRTPGAIRLAATEVVSYGTPMLPGSMLMIAYHHQIPILGLPGCVMHDPYTSFDVFLPRILAGEKIEKKDVIQLGYGGLYHC